MMHMCVAPPPHFTVTTSVDEGLADDDNEDIPDGTADVYAHNEIMGLLHSIERDTFGVNCVVMGACPAVGACSPHSTHGHYFSNRTKDRVWGV
jgi:hypothetical protein